MLILKYLNREVINTMLAVIIILLLIVISNMFVRYLTIAAGGGIAGTTVFKFIGLMMPKYIAYLLPISFFFSIVIVYGKLFANNELMVILACGTSWMKIVRITFVPVIIIFIIEAILTLMVLPYMVSSFNFLKQSIGHESPINLIQAGKIMSFDNGSQVIYTETINKSTNEMHNIFIYQKKPNTNKSTIITAPIGYQKGDDSGTQYLVLENGYFYQGTPGSKDYQKGTFKQSSQYISGQNIASQQQSIEGMPLDKLLKQNTPEASAELQWRLAFPLAVLVSTLMGIAICRLNPRQSRYGRVLPAILIFVIYFNLVSMARSWLGNGFIPPWLGIWWVHIIFAGFAFFIILKINGPIFNTSSVTKQRIAKTNA